MWGKEFFEPGEYINFRARVDHLDLVGIVCALRLEHGVVARYCWLLKRRRITCCRGCVGVACCRGSIGVSGLAVGCIAASVVGASRSVIVLLLVLHE